MERKHRSDFDIFVGFCKHALDYVRNPIVAKVNNFDIIPTVTEETPHWPVKDEDADATAPVHVPKDIPPIVDTDVQDDFDKRYCKFSPLNANKYLNEIGNRRETAYIFN